MDLKFKMFFKKYKNLLLFAYSTLALCISVGLYFYRPLIVSGSSMYPSLNNNDRVLIEKFNGDLKTLHYGDVIVFSSPVNTELLLIKRVIGLPGDKIAIENGKVYLNNYFLTEPYKNNELTSFETLPAFRIPENCVFVLGDNRLVSSDSRELGAIHKSRIFGKQIIKIP